MLSLRLGTALVFPVLTTALLAQTASYTAYGKACPGTANAYGCIQNNAAGGTPDGLLSLGADPQVAIQIDAPRPMAIVGFDLYTYTGTSRRTVKAWIYGATSAGQPQAQPLSTTTITVDAALGWYRASFATPLTVASKQRFFVSWEVPGGRAPFNYPSVMSGNPYPAWARTGTQSWYSSTVLTRFPWAFRVHCTGQGQVAPSQKLQGLPKLGSIFGVSLSGAPALAPYLVVSGASKTQWGSLSLPLDLAPLGAKGCQLLASIDFASAGLADASGQGLFSFLIPQDTRLLGIGWHQQAIVFDPKANPLGLTFSDGGSVLIGR